MRDRKTFDLTFFIFLIVFLVLLYAAIFFLPQLIINSSPFQIPFTESIGRSFGNFVGTFVAMIAAFLTFIAFWVQYKANQQQWRSIQIDRLENRLYQMLNLHKQNVNEIEIAAYSGDKEKTILARNAFPYLFNEFRRTYFIVEKYINQFHNVTNYQNNLTSIAYIIFYVGVEEENKLILVNQLKKYFEVSEIDKIIKEFESAQVSDFFPDEIGNDFYKEKFKYQNFKGYISSLDHYYRHLFQIVKYIDEYPSEVLSESEKYNYVKTLRAQLSNYEQLLLYYSAISSFGKSWIKNKYLTKYKLIKNMPLNLADFGIIPQVEFKREIEETKLKGQEFFEWSE